MTTLEQVKKALNITGNYQDETLQEYIDEVIDFAREAGVAEWNITSGLIARAVNDLWNYGEGKGELSPYVTQRIAQLSFKV